MTMFTDNDDFFGSLNSDELEGFLDPMDLFGEESESGTKFARVKRFRRPRMEKFEYAMEAARAIGRLDSGEHVNMLVSGNFIAGDFIEAYLFENHLVADEIIISTLSMSRENVDSLVNVKKRLAGRMGLIISDYFFAHERRDGVEDIITHLAGDDFFLAVAGIHTKITLIKTQCGMNLVIGGSANLRSSLNVEQITLDNDADLYAFHREWMADILNEYHVHHRMLRREALWQRVVKNAAPAAPGAVSERLN